MTKFIIDQQAEDIEVPENLRLNTFLREFHSDCPHPECSFGFYGFAFGQSPFPVPGIVQDALRKNADKGTYAGVSGIPELRKVIANYNKDYFDLEIDPSNVYVGPGTKELLYNLLEVLHGTVILPTPAWLGYLPQIRFRVKNFHMLPVSKNKKITANKLEHLALRLHDRQKILILNNPNNPTGLVYSRLELEEIADVCRSQGIIVISDEIYAQTTYDMKNFCSMAKVYPEGTIITNGLSKSHSAGGYRLGYVIFPSDSDNLQKHFKKILATEYTATSTPTQFAAIAGFTKSKELDDYFEVTRQIHNIMGQYTYAALNEIEGIQTTKPQSTFYLLADFNSYSADFQINKISTSLKFSQSLIVHPYHTAIVGGDSLVLERNDFSARIAFVDYDGTAAMKNYISNPPKTESDRTEFVKNNAPRVIAGINMLKRYVEDLKNKTIISVPKKREML
ncbi:MAG: pyridoxal phosphate-dependent aminotransferase [Nitrosopumilaceae archaeon]